MALDDTRDSHLRYYRLLLLIAALVYPLWGFIFLYADPTVQENFPERFSISVICVTFWALSRKLVYVQERIESFFLAAIFWMTAQYLHICHVNHFAHVYAIGYFIVIAACLASFNSLSHLRVYSAGLLIASMTSLAIVETTTSKFLMFVGVFTIQMVYFIAQSGRLRILSRMEDTEERLRNAQHIAHLGNWKVDLVEKKSFWSQQVFKILGLDPSIDKASVEVWRDMIHPEDRAEAAAQTQESIATGKPFHSMRRILLKNGEVKYSRIWCNPEFDFQGKVIGLNGVFMDVTESVKQDELLRQSQLRVAEAAKMAALGEMAAGVAHEINNPLAVIRVRAEQIGNIARKVPAPNEEQKEAIAHSDHIIHTTDRIVRIIRNLRAFARDGSKDPKVVATAQEVINDTLSFCIERLRQREIKLDLTYAEEATPIFCRPSELAQVFLNLLNNSIDAIESLPEKWITVEVALRGSMTEITVTDSGHGIPQSVREKIFNPFFTTKGTGKGTGLGLSISAAILQANQATITLDSHCPNTRFVVRVPSSDSRQE